jgi:hypothetical protein
MGMAHLKSTETEFRLDSWGTGYTIKRVRLDVIAVAGFFHHKDGGNRFLRNVSMSLLHHTVLHYRSQYSSQ